jgi:hypothetical protein
MTKLHTDHDLVVKNVAAIERGDVMALRVSAEHYLYLARPYLRSTAAMVRAAQDIADNPPYGSQRNREHAIAARKEGS